MGPCPFRDRCVLTNADVALRHATKSPPGSLESVRSYAAMESDPPWACRIDAYICFEGLLVVEYDQDPQDTIHQSDPPAGSTIEVEE